MTTEAFMDADLDRTCGVNHKAEPCTEPTVAVWVMECRCGEHGQQTLRLCAEHLGTAESGGWPDVVCAYCGSPANVEPHWCPVDVRPAS